MRNYRKYEARLLRNNYDVAIIGSGLGGLTAAVLLAKAGKKVIILERHYRPGGFTHVFKRQKYEWDVGVHYVGQVINDNSIMKKLFDIVTDKKLKWDDIGEIYDRAIIDDVVFDFRKGEGNLKKDLKDRFPDEEEAIDKYFILLKKVAKSSGWFFGERTMPPFVSRTLGYFLRRKFEPYTKKTTLEVLKGITENQELISILCTQCGNYGLPPDRSSFAMHSTIVGHYLDGAGYPRGGAFEIYKSMSKIICAGGGEIYVNAEVQNIEVSNNKVIGLKMADGSIVKAEKYISNAGLHNTFSKLLPADSSFDIQRDKIESIGPSTSHFCLYAGFKGTDTEIGFPAYNIWNYKGTVFSEMYDTFLENPDNDLPLTYISFPSAKDTSWQKRYPGRSTVQVVVPANYEWFKKWEGSNWKDRPESYNVFKEKMKDRILEELFKLYPMAKSYLDYAELSTPLTTKHFSNYQHGEIYGLSHTPERFSQKWIRVYSPIKNLFLTGQDILTVGVGGALFSGAFAAFGILKWRLLKVIKRSVKEI